VSKSALRLRRFRYRTGSEPYPELLSRTLPRRVLYGALFFYLAYAAHLYAFVKFEDDGSSPRPAATSASVAPVTSGLMEPALAWLVQGSGRAGS
jgi:hypothetical protein